MGQFRPITRNAGLVSQVRAPVLGANLGITVLPSEMGVEFSPYHPVCGASRNPVSLIFVTFSCYRRQPLFATGELSDHFVTCLEDMRRHFELCIYGYVVMPEHVHLLLGEPPRAKLAEAIHFLKLSFAKRCEACGRQTRPAPSGRRVTTTGM